MAVKPITNPNPVPLENLNRANQKSFKNSSDRTMLGNRERSVQPTGTNYSKDYEVVIKDLDTAIMSHVKDVMDIRINENNEMIKVPVYYGNEERWKNIRKNGAIRDKNGSLILPLIVFKRTNIEYNKEIPSYKHDVKKDYIQVVRNSKYSKDSRYDRFNVQQGIKPVTENLVTGVPEFCNAIYEFVCVSQYIEQMNKINESFVEQHNTYWGNNTSYKFLCRMDGGINDVSEVSVESERMIKSTFTINLKGYLIPQIISDVINKKKFQAKTINTARSIVFSENIK